jgi:quinol monooxygenase YgiN
MSISTVVMFDVRSGKEIQFQAALERVLESTSRAKGFLRCDRYRDPADPRRYLLHEVWTDGSDLEPHVKSDYFQRFLTETNDLVEAKDIRVLEPF